MTKKDKIKLITMDERFINWLADYDVQEELGKGDLKKYIVVSMTIDQEVSVDAYDTVEEVKEGIKSTEEDSEGGWYAEAVFDTEQSKELSFTVTTTVEVEQ